MKVYLAHPFLEKEYGMEIHCKLEALGLTVLNPFIRTEQPLYEKIIKEGKTFGPEYCRMIVESDLRLIEQADAIVALVTGKSSIGTHMEVFYASRILKHPVFALYTLIGPAKLHPWYEFLAQCYTTESDLFQALKEWIAK